jgi:hypothetical protein
MFFWILNQEYQPQHSINFKPALTTYERMTLWQIQTNRNPYINSISGELYLESERNSVDVWRNPGPPFPKKYFQINKVD